nr:hypothetical protein [Anaerolineae bacterium]
MQHLQPVQVILEGWRRNPLVQQVLRNNPSPSLRSTTRATDALSMIGFLVAAGNLLVDSGLTFRSVAPRAIIGVSVLVSIAGLPIAALITAASTVERTRNESFHLLRISTLSRKTLVTGYLLSAAYQLRLLWAAVLALLPALVVSVIHYFVTLDLGIFCSGRTNCISLPEALPFSVLLAIFLIATALLSIVSLYWLVLCASIWASLRIREIGAASLVALGLALGAWLGMAVIFFLTKPVFPFVITAVSLGLFFIGKEIRLHAERLI